MFFEGESEYLPRSVSQRNPRGSNSCRSNDHVPRTFHHSGRGSDCTVPLLVKENDGYGGKGREKERKKGEV